MPVDDEMRAFCTAQYRPLVRTMALYTGDAQLAEDLAQEALTRAVRDWPKLRTLASPGAYVHRMAINLAKAHFRRRLTERRASCRLSAGVEESTGGPDPADVLAVRAAVRALPPRRRAIVVLRFEACLPLAEIADVLHISIGTVKSQLHDAVATLRTTLRIEEEHHVH